MGIESDVIIGGADGPTDIFLLDKSKEPTFKQRIQRRITRIRRYHECFRRNYGISESGSVGFNSNKKKMSRNQKVKRY